MFFDCMAVELRRIVCQCVHACMGVEVLSLIVARVACYIYLSIYLSWVWNPILASYCNTDSDCIYSSTTRVPAGVLQ